MELGRERKLFSRILVPVDLAHIEKMGKALDCASLLATSCNATIALVGITSTAPGAVAHTPEEFEDVLRKFATTFGSKSGVATDAVSYVAHDPAVELNTILIKAAADISADLIIMASHVPGVPDHIFQSHSGAVASHAPVSVLIVR